MIRPFEAEDGDAVAALLAEDPLPEAVTGDGIRHWVASQPERAQAALWVAEADGAVAGWARARLRWATSAEGVSELWAFVSPGRRGEGLGAALFSAAHAHLRAAGARVVESWAVGEAGGRFLRARGFEAVRTHPILVLDVASADVSDLEEAAAAAAAQGYELVPLAAVADPESLHVLDAETTADVPGTFAEDDARLEDWLPETLGHPQLTRDGSFVVVAGGKPVAHALLHVHTEARLAANEMTGAHRDHRRRGLARLAKLATIAWAREQGYMTILTACDEDNAGMLSLNASLGYRRVATETEYLLEELR
ncbi:MAG TPA: GNAT family N-acetyltransferase [Gaiellaceae bacterium]|nr:GNAT family N-acetyltransferase [Gaiellaceae bacterium]